MNLKRLKEILMLGENKNIEFKSQCQNIDEIGATICGFLNTSGGHIICGVDDQGTILGIDDFDSHRKNLETRLFEGLSPNPLIFVQVQEIEGKVIIVIEVPLGNDIPYAFQNIIYIRVDQTTRKADNSTIRELVLGKQIEPERWERRFSTADIEKDLDYDEIRSTIENISSTGRMSNVDRLSPEKFLETLAFSKYGRLTNAGDILFTSNPSIRHPQVRVRVAVFTSEKDVSSYQDSKSFEGPLEKSLKNVEYFIQSHIPTESRFVKGELKRKDKPLYPFEVIREGLVNAFAHRDYSDFSGGIIINIYPNRLEIWNSAKFPNGMTLEKILERGISLLPNPDIVNALYLKGYMEKMGRGSILIRRSCAKNQLPPPKWTSDNFGVTLTLRTFSGTDGVKNQELKNQELKNQELKNQELKNQELKNQELKNQELKNQERKNRELKNEKLKNQELKNQERKNRILKNQELKNEKLKSQERKNQERKKRILKSRELKSLGLSQKIIDLLEILLNGEKSRKELQSYFKLKDPESFRKRYLERASEKGLIEKTGKLNNPWQKYRITEKGRNFLVRIHE